MARVDSSIAAQLSKALARAAKLEEALRPFASAYSGIDPRVPLPFEILVKIDATPVARLTVGDLHKAHRAMHPDD